MPTASEFGDRGGEMMLRASAMPRVLAEMPSRDAMQAQITARLLPVDRRPQDAPPDLDEAIGQVFSRMMARWRRHRVEELPDGEAAILCLIDALCRAEPDTAARLAQSFRRPDVLLKMRTEVHRLARERASYDRAFASLNETQALWQAKSFDQDTGMVDALEAMTVPDLDLWHHIVLNHDPDDPAQRAAALWCVRQKACDRATVAAWLVLTACHGGFARRVRRDGPEFIDALRMVIERWNNGSYRTAELGLDPPDRLRPMGPRALNALSKAAQMLDLPPLAEPKGLFSDYRGRLARDRSFWCLASGRLLKAPTRKAFIGSVGSIKAS
ncbi:hypothetical protein [Cognatishimia sp. F0-27]|uniref:hypothetical protein n=1 Tax=Cognatishimia sp. F0-27 TaxID=2816855 RepID=UPI001D0BF700|nr:hypothetical protein [Cognatishimia sp. F0-27]MCC1494280.1 hypothetical protein [Cognatishimia sp. F0-27]